MPSFRTIGSVSAFLFRIRRPNGGGDPDHLAKKMRTIYLFHAIPSDNFGQLISGLCSKVTQTWNNDMINSCYQNLSRNLGYWCNKYILKNINWKSCSSLSKTLTRITNPCICQIRNWSEHPRQILVWNPLKSVAIQIIFQKIINETKKKEL